MFSTASLLASIFLFSFDVSAQSDDVCLSVRRNADPEAIQGRPGKQGATGAIGPVGPPGPEGSCTCNVEEQLRRLEDRARNLTGLLNLFFHFCAVGSFAPQPDLALEG